MARYAVIMAGGSGTRLWPMSRACRPKQLLPLVADNSLLQIACDRLESVFEPEHQLICTAERFRVPIRAAMPRFLDEQILGEPEGRDTLAAVGLPAAILQEQDPDAVIATFTADHLIEPVDIFQQRVRTALKIAEDRPDTLVTFGIQPTHAATAYGYVQQGEPLPGFEHARQTLAFKEKPDLATAQAYLKSGDYLWNSGMFVWRARTLLNCIERYQPEVHQGLRRIAESWGTESRAAVLAEQYPQLHRTSVDYGVMEPAADDDQVSVATVDMPVGWVDVGSWTAFESTLDPDAQGNRATAEKVLFADSRHNLVVCEDPKHLVATLGVQDLIVVHTENATLVCRRQDAEQIKQLHQQVQAEFGEDFVS
ncbi:MAG: mannose-1-phosphate guanylyltransferase [Phycisphaerae bacterium]|nr:mannose-1-phosphate guanylyltransferase [Phycisphaerae bacterium]